ncbi:MAG: class I SAM-dependent methyltransferase [Gammaproteobacteria bacterium]
MTSRLHEQRLFAVQAAIRDSGARSIIDLGCGDGDLIVRLLYEPQITHITGIDLSHAALQHLRLRLGSAAPDTRRPPVQLLQGSMTDLAATLEGFDCAVMLETLEHIEPRQLSVLEHCLFVSLRPLTVVMTTPNADYNALLGLAPYQFRHPGHRFEWGRQKFRHWVQGIAGRHGYACHCTDLGDYDPDYGGASQMAVFNRAGSEDNKIQA